MLWGAEASSAEQGACTLTPTARCLARGGEACDETIAAAKRSAAANADADNFDKCVPSSP